MNIITLGETDNETRDWFKRGGERLRERYARKPAMHLSDFDRKMNEVRLARTPRTFLGDIPNVAA